MFVVVRRIDVEQDAFILYFKIENPRGIRVDDLARALPWVSSPQLVEDGAFEEDRMPVSAADGRSDDHGWRCRTRIDELRDDDRGDQGDVDGRDECGSGVRGQSFESGEQRGELPPVGVGIGNELGVELGNRGRQRGVLWTPYNQHGRHPPGAERAHEVPDEGVAGSGVGQQGFGTSHPGRPPGRQDDPCDHYGIVFVKFRPTLLDFMGRTPYTGPVFQAQRSWSTGYVRRFCRQVGASLSLQATPLRLVAYSLVATLGYARGAFWEDTGMPTGTIARLLIDKGFGFIRDEGGIEHFFHRSAVRGAVFELLREGQRVDFQIEESAKGPRAGDVRLIES